ncbi:MAG: HAD-IIB family hydrolase [Nitrospira sp.]|nr:HAD-IIB family hydrolase [Nitrospira sp.]MCP9463015.1 HAD-IIB family hydrolase [Nitrospira sp.]MCP9474608.1 HAD-IIB family hydrolase [Nitrospira sp.]
MNKNGTSSWSMVVFTDLDGTLLNSRTYRFDEAGEALDALHARRIPVVLVSSKTRAEMEPIRYQLRNDHPFIVENGGAVFIPAEYFSFPLPATGASGPYRVVEFGTPYPLLRKALKEIEREVGLSLTGYGDLSADGVASRTGLSSGEAALAKQREYDEPFFIEGTRRITPELAAAIKRRGMNWTTGDRCHHLMGDQDKGRAVLHLIQYYRQAAADHHHRLTTVAVGNSLNDLPMLAAVDRPILVQQADGSYAPGVDLPGLIRAPAPGPIGWNQAILSLLR